MKVEAKTVTANVMCGSGDKRIRILIEKDDFCP